MDIQFIQTNTFTNGKSETEIQVDDKKVKVLYWSELYDQWGVDGLKSYIIAEALKQLNRLEEAHELLKLSAKGEIKRFDNGSFEDTRNWEQNWIDSNPLPKQIQL